MPRPTVGSAVVKLTRYPEPPVEVTDVHKMFALIRAVFNQRRKTMVNSIANASGLGIPKEQILNALEQMGEDPAVRGETFTLSQFAQFSNLVCFSDSFLDS